MDFTQQHPLTQEIKTEAYRLGFSLAGVTHPGVTEHFTHYQAWLDAGRHAGMALPGDGTRPFPARRPWPGAAGMPFDPGIGCAVQIAAKLNCSFSGCSVRPVAAYAWGEDYHLVLADRLQTLGKSIAQLCGAGTVFKGYSDTGPILERDLAQRRWPGLDWQKHLPDQPPQGLLLFPGGAFSQCGVGRRRPLRSRWLRRVPAMRPGMSDRRDPAGAYFGCPALYCLPDHRKQGRNPRRPASFAGRLGFRLRYLPDGVSLEYEICAFTW